MLLYYIIIHLSHAERFSANKLRRVKNKAEFTTGMANCYLLSIALIFVQLLADLQ